MTFISLVQPIYFNVKQYGAVGNGVTDDTTAIQTAINAASSAGGGTVFFPVGTYMVSATIQLADKCHYLGVLGDEQTPGSQIKQMASANLDAVCATAGWYNNQTFSAVPVIVENLAVNGNSSNQTGGTGHALVIMSSNSSIRRCFLGSSRGDGLVITVVNRGGTTLSNNLTQCYVQDCEVSYTTGNGIHVVDPAGNKNTDHFLLNNLVHDNGLHSINCEAAAGTVLRGNHTYDSAWCGITVGNAAACSITENYIDGYGSDTTQAGLAGIQAYITGPRGTVIAHNRVVAVEPGSSTVYRHIAIYANDSSNPVFITISGNQVYGNFSGNPSANSSHSYGLWLDETSNQSSGGHLATYVVTGNTIGNCGTNYIKSSDATAFYPLFLESVSGNVTMTGSLAVGQSSSAPDPGASGTITTANVGVARVSPSGGSRTGCILQAGTTAGQEVWVVNEHASNTISWAIQATSHIAGEAGGTFVLGADKAQQFVWSSGVSLWFKAS